ncbi:MAG: D-galactarate dehydratase [Alphaproteobacteria bacterium]|nr:MAG: D-galactarate dehydratase [Alphaproteobacteria bacterium]
MRPAFVLLALAMALAGCSLLPRPDASLAPPPGAVHPAPRPGAVPAVPDGARTVDEFDTTSQSQRAEAEAEARAEEGRLIGRTVAALGNPADPGFWLETPLAEAPGKGRVVSAENGKAVALDLRPIDGPDTAGSRISLPALRLLGLPLGGLHLLDVYALGPAGALTPR